MDPDRGRVAAYRWHLPDPVRFQDSIRVELEHGHGNEVLADVATVAYWYQTEPHRPFPPLPDPAVRRTLDIKIPAGAALLDSLERVEDGQENWNVRLPVPRPDRYAVWTYPRGPDGRPMTPRILHPLVSVTGASLELEFPAGEPLPTAVHAVPVPRWATDWLVVGPFPNPQQVGTEHSPAIDSVFPPEEDPDPTRSYRLPTGAAVEWRLASGDSTGYVRLNPHFEPNDWVVAYAQAFLHSSTAREVVLLLGTDDAHQLWVNGTPVSSRQGRNISVPDDLEVRVNLRPGWNRVLLKVADLDGGWAFHLRAADPSDELRWAVVASGL